MKLVMGVVNVTPDSFSDGGETFDTRKAISRGLSLAQAGADILDIGGESSRPGALSIDAREEMRRIIPVVEALSPIVRVSVDTTKEEVARRAVLAGATLINDISSGLAHVAADLGVGWVAMHMQASPEIMQRDPRYSDVVFEVRNFLIERGEYGRRLGISEVWIDPGIGFGKTIEHNLALLREIDFLADCDFPVLVGTSRKTFIGKVAARFEGEIPPPKDRLEGSLATAAWCFRHGVSAMRVHDVKETIDLCRLAGYR